MIGEDNVNDSGYSTPGRDIHDPQHSRSLVKKAPNRRLDALLREMTLNASANSSGYSSTPGKESKPALVSKSYIRRLARQAGVPRFTEEIYAVTENFTRAFLSEVFQDAMGAAAREQRDTIMARDIVYGLKCQGPTLYGPAFYHGGRCRE
ncbi:uncharacterized protein LOC129739445 isoform X2 [Uranotaenia lowii]|nr:uncharacterized protein LOC129739445 isoform X2 [Uranotaenia lowii]